MTTRQINRIFILADRDSLDDVELDQDEIELIAFIRELRDKPE